MQNSTMPRTTIILGAVLVLVGVIGYFASGMASWTALIPAILGVALLVCGLIALRSPKVGVHIALVLALLGIAGTFMNVLRLGELFAGTAERPLAVVASVVTFVLLVVYLVLGIRSFIAARRWRREHGTGQ
ncbi:hypothetical protein OH146_08515 [Salinibacterium sp. SYSU T00001]|uniref:hypothetical protein n=1 Tax=Homoserinimonas sedimenticola TaxID=2986805 RepID=UPI00223626F7|nr:hypothetical protein [Salinibacterium sedimenticola]MCW4385815.1 hypothetical protein [Salinibacterium sedimenticola]